jgi:MraZ protein
MSSTVSISPPEFRNKYPHGVDDKRRLQIPARWRPSDPEMEFTVIVWDKGKANCHLLVLTPHLDKKMTDQVNQLPFGDPKAVRLRRLLGSYSDKLKLDKSGRMMIPEDFAREAGIEKEAKLVGNLDRFEIWDPKRFKDVSEADDADLDSLYQMI